MNSETQISTIISQSTQNLLEQHVRATGLKKGHLVEQALLHHLQALHELPADVMIHPKMVVTRNSGDAIVKKIQRSRPTKALRALMADGD